MPGHLLDAADTITVPAGRTSGEAEPVLVRAQGEWLLTVGSDHTDRELERDDIETAKLACPKLIARDAWPLAAVAARWDELALTASIEIDGTWLPYQRGSLAELRRPEWFTAEFDGPEDAVVFCGTIATLSGLTTRANRFRAELTDPQTGATLACEYALDARR
jgi:hypothetical protein